MYKRRGVIVLVFLLSLLSLPQFAFAQAEALTEGLRLVASVFGPLFTFGWAAGNEEGIMRALFFIIVFTLVYFSLLLAFKRMDNIDDNIGKRLSVTVAAVIALTSGILTPYSVVLAIFSIYSGFVVSILMLLFLFACLFLAYKFVPEAWPMPLQSMVRILVLFLLIWGLQLFLDHLIPWLGGLP